MNATLSPIGNENVTEVCEVVGQLIRTFVGHPHAVRIETSTEMNTTMLRVRVARADLGKVVGKDGRTARALGTILAAAGQANYHRFVLDIEERPEEVTDLPKLSD